ncbi:PhoH family protein [Candidatus Saccharibacteria bacterium]|nr:PhoH family protein [Candidatus Saccharibacteria bacterium]
MSEKKMVSYVIDTNVIIDYVDILPKLGDDEVAEPADPSIDFTSARLIIPSTVIRELSKFKKEHSERGKASREALKRIRKLFKVKCKTMKEIYGLEETANVEALGRMYALLPIHKNFRKQSPFAPADNDMDGQIILAALVVKCANAALPVDGTADPDAVMELQDENVILITNDNGLAERAWERGVLTAEYRHQYPDDYTGIRTVVVPYELYKNFINLHRIELSEWQAAMPNERRLVANEFIVMKMDASNAIYPPNYDPQSDPYFTYIGRYDVDEEAIVGLKHVSSFPVKPKSVGQAVYAEALAGDFDVVICTGPAGSGKTYMSSIYAYQACKDGRYLGATVVPCEVNKSYGALPGDLNEKLDPDVQPIKNALRNYLLKNDPKLGRELEKMRKNGFSGENGCKKAKKCRDYSEDEDNEASEKRPLKLRVNDRVDLIFDNWFSVVPVDNARGRDFAYEFVEYDEFQDQNIARADMLIKRIGENGKVVITGDIQQIHAPYVDIWNNGIVYVGSLLYDYKRVVRVSLSKEDVWRHEVVKEIARRQEGKRIPVPEDTTNEE